MAKKNSQSNSQQQQPEGETRYNKEQYEMLKRCSDKKDMTEWNKWREEHPDERVDLQEAPLEKFCLRGANLIDANLVRAHLENANLRGAHLENAYLGGANLIDADLGRAHLENTNLRGAHLKNADLRGANLENASLRVAHLENADLVVAHLKNTNLRGAHLKNADLRGAHLENASLRVAHLENANLRGAHLENAYLGGANLIDANLGRAHLENANLREARLENAGLWKAHLQGANVTTAIVDGATLIWNCEVNRYSKGERFTDFAGVGLNSVRIDAGTKQILEYNVRRSNWEVWYKKHWLLRWLVRWFWHLSDYGLSTWRVIIWFFVLSLIFAAVYSNLALWWPPGVVNDLYVEPEISQRVSQLDYIDYGLEVFFRPIYFSVVTMTTLGFGDMYARRGSWLGHVLLTVQVILGYVLLGALVTRFAVLFTAGGPAGTFSEREPEKTAESEREKKPKGEQSK